MFLTSGLLNDFLNCFSTNKSYLQLLAVLAAIDRRIGPGHGTSTYLCWFVALSEHTYRQLSNMGAEPTFGRLVSSLRDFDG